MNVKVWNLELPPFPREGLNHLMPSEECMVSMYLKREAAKLTRFNQFDMPVDAADLKARQDELRAKLWEKMGTVYENVDKLPLETTIFGKIQYDGFSVTKLSYQGQRGVHVSALLYVPDGPGPFPAIIHMHGHSREGKYAERVQCGSLTLVHSGYVVLAVDAFGTYERATQCRHSEYHGGLVGGGLLNVGESLMGGQVVDNMRGVDLLQSLPFVDPERIGATGASGGGNQTMWLAAMDERIKVAMPVVSVGSFESYVTGVNCICELLPDGLTFTDEAGVLGLIAPRPLNIGNAFYDVNHTFSVAEMLKTYHIVKAIYWHLGAHDNICYTITDQVHGMHPKQREAVIGWMDCHLKGEGTGRPRPEPEYTPVPEEELYLFPADQRPANIRGIVEHCIIQGDKLHEKMMQTAAFDRAATVQGLADVLRFKGVPAEMKLRKHTPCKGYDRYSLACGEHLIPIVIKPGSAAGKFRVLLAKEGKIAITDEEIAKAGADGASVVMFDLFNTGETAQPNTITGEFTNTVRQLIWVGRTLPGEWTRDILSVCTVLKRELGAQEVIVDAGKECGACLLFAAALDQGKVIDGANIADIPGSLVFHHTLECFVNSAAIKRVNGCLYTAMLSIPGFLKWGDIALAAALSKNVKITAPRLYDGTPLDADAVAAFENEIAVLKTRIN